MFNIVYILYYQYVLCTKIQILYTIYTIICDIVYTIAFATSTTIIYAIYHTMERTKGGERCDDMYYESLYHTILLARYWKFQIEKYVSVSSNTLNALTTFRKIYCQVKKCLRLATEIWIIILFHSPFNFYV